jgi:hypothetical protein
VASIFRAKKEARGSCLLHASSLFGLLFDPEGTGDMFNELYSVIYHKTTLHDHWENHYSSYLSTRRKKNFKSSESIILCRNKRWFALQNLYIIIILGNGDLTVDSISLSLHKFLKYLFSIWMVRQRKSTHEVIIAQKLGNPDLGRSVKSTLNSF